MDLLKLIHAPRNVNPWFRWLMEDTFDLLVEISETDHEIILLNSECLIELKS